MNAPPKTIPTLAFVVPCFNEELVLDELIKQLTLLSAKLLQSGLISQEAQIVLVDDGSVDNTWNMVETASVTGNVMGIKLARNHGHQPALLAGLMTAKADILVSLDADLQDDLEAIPKMIEAYMGGAEIVFGVRSSRKSDTWFKRNSARTYYKMMHYLGVDLIADHADFRLMGRKAINALREYGEVNIFLRGLIKNLGFPTSTVEYDRAARVAGETKYPFRKMVRLALEGVTSFSVRPLRLVAWAGLTIALFSFIYVGYAVIMRFMGHSVSGWASIVASIYMLGGIQLIALGVIGEYLGKIYLETKKRPQFIIEKTTAD
ncbi:glycosyltransferase family 2 protein [Yoonia maritima]|uniref:glycosyltransferase family 2 protein n=1 Tax=Yoonia maritima TaxID=1435347 RepID=UPI000D0E3F8F|nr:glycosyltransferase family 2 protein [Yoonia maritima]